MRIRGHRDDALPPLPLAGVIENRHGPRRLHNLKKKAGVPAKVWQNSRHTALPKAAVLWIVGAIDDATSAPRPPSRGDRQVVGRRLRSFRRWRPVRSARA